MAEVQVFRPSTPKAAVFRAKRWFYARFYTPAYRAGKTDIAEKNKERWAELAGKIIEKTQNLGSDHIIRLTIFFDTKTLGETKDSRVKIEEFIPVAIKIEMYKKTGEEIVELTEGGREIAETTPAPTQGEI